ncbi:MAG: MATE family efflux transporter, partial [Rhodobacteraceae bacterium]|nr:MATE family efflux transporter [Paracoccaceae bacterium]
RMMQVNGDIMLRSILLQGAFTGFIFLSAGKGDVTLAANQVLLQFLEITAYGLDGFAFAAESLVGQAVGARSVREVRRASILTSQWGVGGALVLGVFFWVAGPAIIDLMATDPAVRIEARSYLAWVAVAPVLGIASWMFDGIFIGATRSREMRNSSAISVVIYAAAVIAFAGWGNHGLWAALMVLNVTRAVTLGAVYGRVERAAA